MDGVPFDGVTPEELGANSGHFSGTTEHRRNYFLRGASAQSNCFNYEVRAVRRVQSTNVGGGIQHLTAIPRKVCEANSIR
jgi:hypothetical protein